MQIEGRELKGLLVDLDGVLYVGREVIAGTLETVARLESSGIPHRYVTNTTTKSRDALVQQLSALGFCIERDRILTAPLAARAYLETLGKPTCKLLMRDEVKDEFSDFEQSDTDAEAVVIGDIGAAWDYALLNQVFRLLMNGARLIALHRNKFWQTESGLCLDIGAFVAGLEYCSGRQAVIAGKPNPAFFAAALAELGLEPHEVAMIGDDIDNDVGGAQSCGLMGVLVRTGKYRKEYADAADATPDALLDSFADLPL